MSHEPHQSAARTARRIGLVAGPIVFGVLLFVLPERYEGASGASVDFPHAARATTAIAAWMAVWWLTEATHMTVTALLPILLFPLLHARTIDEAVAPYAHRLIFLFMGGFIIALAMERWGLHRRIALRILCFVGAGSRSVVAGFMIATAFLSMWVSNTATSLMMLPIGLSVIDLVAGESSDDAAPDENFAVCLLLGIAYAASVGGASTVIGTPPNIFLRSFLADEFGVEISFARWLLVGLPLLFLLLPCVWTLLCFVLFPVGGRIEGGDQLLQAKYRELGPMNRGERITLVVFLSTATLWIARAWLTKIEIGEEPWQPLEGLTDTGIAVGAAIALFLLPVDSGKRQSVMDWEHTKKLPWGTLLLFGGGLSLAAAIRDNGVGEFFAANVAAFRGWNATALCALVTTLVIFLTELTSNLATTATLVPLLAGLAAGIGISPLALTIPAALAASCAFMLPVATPPNAVVYGSGRVRLGHMVKAGLWLNVIGVVLIVTLTRTIVVWVFVQSS